MPDKGVGFNALRLHHPRGWALPEALVVFNYLGVSHQGEAAQPWQPLPMAPGAPTSPDNLPRELISLHGGIFDGRLTLRQIGCLRGDLSEQLLQRLHQHLNELADLAGAVQP